MFTKVTKTKAKFCTELDSFRVVTVAYTTGKVSYNQQNLFNYEYLDQLYSIHLITVDRESL